MTECVLCLGSNVNSDKQLRRAASLLHAFFPSIRFSSPLETKALDCPLDTPPFLNMTAVAFTDRSENDVRLALKEMEQSLGRLPSDKLKVRISIDIDLLLWDKICLKPMDMQRDFVRAGLQELGFSV